MAPNCSSFNKQPGNTARLEAINIRTFRTRANKNGLLDIYFSRNERLFCEKHHDPMQHYAARYAAKKAFCRLNGLPIKMLGDIEICRAKDGHVYYSIEKRLADKIGYKKGSILVSISHTKKLAAAFAIRQTASRQQ